MASHIERSIALADQVTAKAEEAVRDLNMEMALKRWPSEFKAIMWDAVALVAQSRAAEARASGGTSRDPSDLGGRS